MAVRKASMELQVLPGAFTVCKVAGMEGVDIAAPFCFTARTDGEWSLTCETERVPPHTVAREDGWRMLRIIGTLDFSLVGILAAVSAVLAEAKVGIFAVSTYDTDYILMKADRLSEGLDALRRAGYTILEEWRG